MNAWKMSAKWDQLAEMELADIHASVCQDTPVGRMWILVFNLLI